jgi:hypothetical protein
MRIDKKLAQLFKMVCASAVAAATRKLSFTSEFVDIAQKANVPQTYVHS